MPRPLLAPTKSNLLKVKEKLVLAVEGHDLLEQKREILMRELMEVLPEVKRVEQALGEAVLEAYPVLEDLLLTEGRAFAGETADAFLGSESLLMDSVVRAGMSFPLLRLRTPGAEAAGGSQRASEPTFSAPERQTRESFRALLEAAVAWAVLRAQVVRLARELKRTQRRVNALEKMVIPQARESKAFIESVLEERERESLFAAKLLKKKAVPGGPSF